jgi:outer membrane receptor protein involved in Fe transport
MRKTMLILVLIVCGLWLIPAAGHAQMVTGTLRGTVTDTSGGVLPGVTIELTGKSLIGGPKSVVTDERGQFRFPSLSPGVYTVAASLQGFQTVRREEVRVEVGSQFEVDFQLKMAGVAEAITVVGAPPLIDTSRSAMTTTVATELVESTPVTRFTFFDLAYMTPGISTMRFDNTASKASAFGASINENQYQLDGADLTAPQTGAAWAWPSTDIIEELQVIGLGAPAEYGNYQGAVFNVVTKSGSNSFIGNANYYYSSEALTGQNAAINGIPYNRARYSDFSVNVGGPIKKDKLWFFAGFQKRQDWYSEPGTDPTAPKETNDKRFFGKITWQATQNNKIVASVEYDGSVLPRPVTVSSPYIAGGAEDSGQPVPNVAWTSVINDKTFFEARYAGFYGYDRWAPNSGSNNIPGHYDTATGVYSVNSTSWYDGNIWKTQVSGKLSRYISTGKGNHDLRVGAQYINGGTDYKEGLSGGMEFYDYAGRPDELLVQSPYHGGDSSKMWNIGTYIDDTWSVNDQLSLTLGLRFDHSVGTVPNYPQLDANGNTTGVTIQNPGAIVKWNNWSPRLGANFKFDSAGKTVARVHYGRFHSVLQTRIFSPLNRATSPSTLYQLDPTTGARVSVISVTDPLIGIPQLQANLNTPYTDQISVGIDHELIANLSIGGSFIYKKAHDLIGRTKPNALYVSVPFTYTDRDGHSETVTLLSQTNNDANGNTPEIINQSLFSQEYKGLVVQASKRMANRWMMLASVTVSKSTGLNAGSASRDPYSNQQSNSGTFGLDPNDFVNAGGVLIGDRPVMFKLQGSYQLPLDIMASIDWQYLSGKPIYTAVRTPSGLLGQGRRYIFDIPTTTELLRAPTDNIFDLRFERKFHLTKRFSASAAINIFNIFNNDAFYSVASTIIPTSPTNPGYEQGVTFVPPRRAQLVVRLNF